MKLLIAAALCAFGTICWFSSSVGAATISVNVDARSAPWDPALNPSFSFEGINFLGPTIINSSDGFSFTAGAEISFAYLSGGVQTSQTWPEDPVDPRGCCTSSPIDAYGKLPSFYTPYEYDQLMSVVAVFTDDLGIIVGLPIAVWVSTLDPALLSVPTGSTQLQLGVVDSVYDDNLGSFDIEVSLVPLPAAAWFLVSGIVGLCLMGWRRKRMAAA